MNIRLLGAALCAMLFSGLASAKTLYVDGASGNDSVSYANNSQSAPWRTLGRAVWGAASPSGASTSEAARAGDVVMVANGPFTAPASNERYNPAFNPVNSGSAGSPITFRAQGRVELRTTGGSGPVIGAYTRNYIRWEGPFYIDENNAPVHSDTGPVVIWQTTGTVVDGCEIQGRPTNYVDNHNGVRFEQARSSTVRNCRITGIVGPGSDLHHNRAGVMLYYSSDITIENNDISNSGAGIYPKGGNNYNITIRYNKISNTRKAVRVSYSDPATGQNRIYQNIIMNGVGDDHIGIEIAEGSNHWTIANNTIRGVNNGIYLVPSGQSGGFRIANNIISSTTTAVNAWEMSAAMPGPGRNLYHSMTQWAWNGRTYSGLSAWLGAAPADAGSVVSDPGFVNVSSGDFRLSSGSQARTLGVDILDLNGNGSNSDPIPAGAYVTGNEAIGRYTGPTPNAPTSVSAL